MLSVRFDPAPFAKQNIEEEEVSVQVVHCAAGCALWDVHSELVSVEEKACFTVLVVGPCCGGL